MKKLGYLATIVGFIMSLGVAVTTQAQDDTFFNTRITYTREELKRVVKELEDDTDKLEKDFRKFLKKERNGGRNGTEQKLLSEINALENAADRFEDHFKDARDPRVLTSEAGDLIRRGFSIDNELYQMSPNVKVQENWRRVRVGLERLADAYSLDRRGQPRRSVVSREQVKTAIAQIESLSDRLKDDFKKFLKKDGRFQRNTTTQQLEAELIVFEKAADDLKKHFDKVNDPRALDPEVQALLERGRNIEELMNRIFVSDEVRAGWTQIRAHLDLLVEAYGFGFVSRY